MQGFNLQTVLEATVRLPFLYKANTVDHVVNLEVYIERVTPEFREKLVEASEKSEEDAVRVLVAEAVKDWDVHMNGTAYPPTYENTCRLPYTFLAAAANAIVGLWQGNPTTANGSQSTSEPKESTEVSPDGISSSEPLATSE